MPNPTPVPHGPEPDSSVSAQRAPAAQRPEPEAAAHLARLVDSPKLVASIAQCIETFRDPTEHADVLDLGESGEWIARFDPEDWHDALCHWLLERAGCLAATTGVQDATSAWRLKIRAKDWLWHATAALLGRRRSQLEASLDRALERLDEDDRDEAWLRCLTVLAHDVRNGDFEYSGVAQLFVYIAKSFKRRAADVARSRKRMGGPQSSLDERDLADERENPAEAAEAAELLAAYESGLASSTLVRRQLGRDADGRRS